MMATIKFDPLAPVTRGFDPADATVNIDITTVVESSAGSAVEYLDDRAEDVYTEATYTQQASVSVQRYDAGRFVVTTPSEALSYDSASGVVSSTSGGSGYMLVQDEIAPARFSTKIPLTLTREVGVAVANQLPTQGKPGTLRAHLWEQALGVIAGKTPGAATQDTHSTATFGAGSPALVKNSQHFLPGLSFAYTSVQKLYQGNWLHELHCHLVSSRHAIFSKHVYGGSFGSVRFVRDDGSVQQVNTLGWYDYPWADWGVLYFDEDVTGISFVKFAPEDIADYLPQFKMASRYDPSDPLNNIPIPVYPLPAFSNRTKPGYTAAQHTANEQIPPGRVTIDDIILPSLSKHTRACVVRDVPGNYPYMMLPAKPWAASYDALVPWGASVMSGDSSSLTFFLINGEAAAVAVQYGYSSGPWLPSYLSLIEAEMNNLAETLGGEVSPNYSLQRISLSGFENFNPQL